MTPFVFLALVGCGLWGSSGPFSGGDSLTVELSGTGSTAAIDGPILQARLAKLGATATSTVTAPDRLVMEVSSLREGAPLHLVWKQNRVAIDFPGPDDIDASHIEDAEVRLNELHDLPEVLVTLTDAGGRRFCELTSANVGQQVTVSVDGVELSAPVVRERICGGQLKISMGHSSNPDTEAAVLAAALATAPLASDWRVEAQR